MDLLTRDEFREAVFVRDNHTCVICHAPAQDAHHIMERRLFPDGGYYLDNGASVCGDCHLKCESTLISTQRVREAAGIETVVLPPHLYDDVTYDKWGNPYSENLKTRFRGELWYDISVQKALAMRFGVPANYFAKYMKYPRTHHLPWSPTPAADDRVMLNCDALAGLDIVVTEKMDGENTTMYDDFIHARSIDGRNHPSRSWVKNFWAEHVRYQIDPTWRICGENMYAKHSIGYDSLPSFFLGFSIWEHATVLSWDDTMDFFALLGITPVPVLYRGPMNDFDPEALDIDPETCEGYVLRYSGWFRMSEWSKLAGKYVRQNHVQTVKHWMHGQAIEPNKLSTNS